jgi:hypothetical protein
MTQEFSKPATTLLRAREQFAVEKRFSSERDPGNQISFVADCLDRFFALFCGAQLILMQMDQSCCLFRANVLQYTSQIDGKIPAPYTFPPTGEIFEARRTTKRRR